MDSLTNSNQLVKTFCVLDDLSVQLFEKKNLGKPNSLSRSEIATIILMKNAFGINCLKKLYLLLQLENKKYGGVKIIDSTPLPVCKNIRIYAHKVMKRITTRSKTTTGWFY